MKQLVNHKGIVQYKWIVETKDELFDYLKNIRSKELGSRVGGWIAGTEINGKLDQLVESLEIAPIELANHILVQLYINGVKHINEGKVLVFNEGGGYCFWNETMELLDWKYLLECNDIVVLENSSIIEKGVKEYLKNKEYTKLVNLGTFTLEEIFYYCSKASTIVFKTQAVVKEQIDLLLNLAVKLEPKEIIIINSDRFPINDIRLSKHNVKVIEYE